MDLTRKLKMAALDKGVKLGDLGVKLGYKRTSFAVKMSRGINYISDLEKIADALDCDIVLVDRETKKVY